MSWEIRWKRKGAKYDEPIHEAWTLHTPLARTPEETGVIITKLLKQHDPTMVTVITEQALKDPKTKKVLADAPFQKVKMKP